MIRIGLVGAISTHAAIFARLLNVEQVLGERARIAAIWSVADPERTREVATAGMIPVIAASLHQLVDQVDAAIIVDRHGDLHAEHALPFLLDRKPVYVDKPFAIDLADCRRMLNAARRSQAAITSFSVIGFARDTEALKRETLGAVRLAQLAGPCDIGSQYGGAFFYATHLIELARALLGDRIAALRAMRAGDTLVVEAVWERDVVATIGYFKDAAYTFRASLFGTSGSVTREIVMGDESYAAALDAIVGMFETGREPFDARHMLQPIVLVHAIRRSLDRDGGWVDVAAMLNHEVNALR
jgi:predicted dehydrogenase